MGEQISFYVGLRVLGFCSLLACWWGTRGMSVVWRTCMPFPLQHDLCLQVPWPRWWTRTGAFLDSNIIQSSWILLNYCDLMEAWRLQRSVISWTWQMVSCKSSAVSLHALTSCLQRLCNVQKAHYTHSCTSESALFYKIP